MHSIGNRTRWGIYGIAILASVLLSVWMSVRESVINPDAICYLQSADAFHTSVQFAIHLCSQAKWPLYSALIFGVSSVTQLSTLTAALILNGFFSLLSVVAFVGIIHSLKNSTRVLGWAVFVILMAHEFNDVRQYIIRDHGFWCFYLLSILFLLQYFRHPRWSLAFLWSISLFIATLFRIEGGIFLLGLPFAVWLDSHKSWACRLRAFLQLNTLTFLVLIMILLGLLLFDNAYFGRIHELQFQFLHGIATVNAHFQSSAQALGAHVLNSFSARDASLILFLLLTVWYVFSVVSNVSLIYAALIFYAWLKKSVVFEKSSYCVLWGYILINVLITATFLVESMFLSKRYLIALSLVFLVWVPFALDDLQQRWQQQKWPLLLALFFILMTATGGIVDFGYSKRYLRDAGEWLANNVSPTQRIYSNDVEVMYYSQHFGNTIFDKAKLFAKMDEKERQAYDFLALRLNKKDDKRISLIPLKVFANKRGDQVGIYKVLH